MTRTVGQSVPPSLANALARVARVSSTTSGGRRIISPALDLYAPEPVPQADANTQQMQRAATWLTQRHAGNLSKSAQSAFYAARLAELRNREFPAEFWWATSPAYAYADYGVPVTVVPFDGVINQEYYDPLRLPSYCPIESISKRYPLPIGNGTASEPGPGWKGAVIDGLYRDLYSVRARFWLTMPRSQTLTSLRPSLLLLNATLRASSSRKGNRVWFYIQYSARIQATKTTGYTTYFDWFTHWNPWSVRAIQLPATNPAGWSYTDTSNLLLDPVSFAALPAAPACNWLELAIWTPPALGLYFAGNDTVVLHGDYTATLYTPRTATE